jgi:hypothetical protein
MSFFSEVSCACDGNICTCQMSSAILATCQSDTLCHHGDMPARCTASLLPHVSRTVHIIAVTNFSEILCRHCHIHISQVTCVTAATIVLCVLRHHCHMPVRCRVPSLRHVISGVLRYRCHLLIRCLVPSLRCVCYAGSMPSCHHGNTPVKTLLTLFSILN